MEDVRTSKEVLKLEKTLIVKVGNGYLFNRENGYYSLNINNLNGISEEMSIIMTENHINVLLVSSGSIGAALWKLGLNEKPKDSDTVSSLAGIGQPYLMKEYIAAFSRYGKTCAQCLIDYHDLNKDEIINVIRKRQKILYGLGVISIYNGNAFLKIENNDFLAAYLAKCLYADNVVMLSNYVDGLGTGGGKSKDEARNILNKDKIKLDIINDYYELEYDKSKYKPKIRKILNI
jgi:glutamate 5-kinase